MTTQDLILLIAFAASAGALWEVVTCLHFKQPPRKALSDYTLEKLRRDSDQNAVIWCGMIRGSE